MLTKEQALKADEFHYGECKKIVGPRGGITIKQEIWRRNGETKVWKTRPNEFRIPVKWGIRSFDYVTHREANDIHVPEDCPLNQSQQKEVSQSS